MKVLEGKVVLISGGARGMGAATARTLVASGASVLVGDLLTDEAAALADELGDACDWVSLDVTQESEWQAAVQVAVERYGRLDGLVNNAGVLRRTPIVGGDLAYYDKIIAVNQTGVFLGMRSVAPVMADRGSGSIVNISSIDGMVGMPDLTAYVASKWAVRGMTKSAAIELGPLGIRCNSVHPGYVDTVMMTGGGRLSEDAKLAFASSVPLGRLGQPEDVAQTTAFLLSDASSYLNGSEIVIDGGLIAGFRLAGSTPATTAGTDDNPGGGRAPM
jgi:3alpha(or 20beta)-hydroxysteroid dehydrogenase